MLPVPNEVAPGFCGGRPGHRVAMKCCGADYQEQKRGWPAVIGRVERDPLVECGSIDCPRGRQRVAALQSRRRSAAPGMPASCTVVCGKRAVSASCLGAIPATQMGCPLFVGLRGAKSSTTRRGTTAGARVQPTGQGRIKAPGCGPVGRVKQVGISAPWHEVHFAREPAFSNNARKTNAWRTSRAAAWSTSAVTAGRSVTPRILRPFGSSQLWWHTAAMACPFTRQLRRSASGLAGGRGRKK